MSDRRSFTLQPLVVSGVLLAGPDKLSCCVGGVDYFAELGANGEIICEGKIFRSPSAFSVYVKRKRNPRRLADDGWTSVKYMGETLATYRNQLEMLLHIGAEVPGNRSPGNKSPGNRSPDLGTSSGKRRSKAPSALTWSTDDASQGINDSEGEGISPDTTDGTGASTQARAGETYWTSEPEQCDQPSIDVEYSWIQCDNPACQKWRKLRGADVPEGNWYCSNNSDSRYNSCDKPQELSDDDIDRQLDEIATTKRVLKSGRPALNMCTPEEFEEDLCRFLDERGEGQLATSLREKRITCNNSPLDVFGLYREVVKRGGLVMNERYDERGRWIGGINFAGDVFPKMRNWTANNRATSVGNQLLNNYKKFLLSYEKAYAPWDLPDVPKCFFQPPPTHAPPNQYSSAQQGTDALAFLADIAGAHDETLTIKTEHGDHQQPVSAPDVAQPLDALRLLNDLQTSWVPTHVPVGTILLAQHPADLSRHWPVVVADPSDLPVSVLSGEACASGANGFPQSVQQASPSGTKHDAVPVLVLGTDWLGWVESSSCRPYTLESGQSAMASAWAGISSEWPATGSLGTENTQPLLSCVRGLKLAALSCSDSGSKDVSPRQWIQAVSLKHIAKRLLELEGQLPSSVFCTANQDFWQAWRCSIEKADTCQGLASAVLNLLHQLKAGAVRAEFHDFLLDQMLQLLGMSGSLVQQKSKAKQRAKHPTQTHPTCLSLDASINVLMSYINWQHVRQLWVSEPPAHNSYASPANTSPSAHAGFVAGDGLRNGVDGNASRRYGTRNSTKHDVQGEGSRPGTAEHKQGEVSSPIPEISRQVIPTKPRSNLDSSSRDSHKRALSQGSGQTVAARTAVMEQDDQPVPPHAGPFPPSKRTKMSSILPAGDDSSPYSVQGSAEKVDATNPHPSDLALPTAALNEPELFNGSKLYFPQGRKIVSSPDASSAQAAMIMTLSEVKILQGNTDGLPARQLGADGSAFQRVDSSLRMKLEEGAAAAQAQDVSG